jgi:hypothetical protein
MISERDARIIHALVSDSETSKFCRWYDYANPQFELYFEYENIKNSKVYDTPANRDFDPETSGCGCCGYVFLKPMDSGVWAMWAQYGIDDTPHNTPIDFYWEFSHAIADIADAYPIPRDVWRDVVSVVRPLL